MRLISSSVCKCSILQRNHLADHVRRMRESIRGMPEQGCVKKRACRACNFCKEIKIVAFGPGGFSLNGGPRYR